MDEQKNKGLPRPRMKRFIPRSRSKILDTQRGELYLSSRIKEEPLLEGEEPRNRVLPVYSHFGIVSGPILNPEAYLQSTMYDPIIPEDSSSSDNAEYNYFNRESCERDNLNDDRTITLHINNVQDNTVQETLEVDVGIETCINPEIQPACLGNLEQNAFEIVCSDLVDEKLDNETPISDELVEVSGKHFVTNFRFGLNGNNVSTDNMECGELGNINHFYNRTQENSEELAVINETSPNMGSLIGFSVNNTEDKEAKKNNTVEVGKIHINEPESHYLEDDFLGRINLDGIIFIDEISQNDTKELIMESDIDCKADKLSKPNVGNSLVNVECNDDRKSDLSISTKDEKPTKVGENDALSSMPKIPTNSQSKQIQSCVDNLDNVLESSNSDSSDVIFVAEIRGNTKFKVGREKSLSQKSSSSNDNDSAEKPSLLVKKASTRIARFVSTSSDSDDSSFDSILEYARGMQYIYPMKNPKINRNNVLADVFMNIPKERPDLLSAESKRRIEMARKNAGRVQEPVLVEEEETSTSSDTDENDETSSSDSSEVIAAQPKKRRAYFLMSDEELSDQKNDNSKQKDFLSDIFKKKSKINTGDTCLENNNVKTKNLKRGIEKANYIKLMAKQNENNKPEELNYLSRRNNNRKHIYFESSDDSEGDKIIEQKSVHEDSPERNFVARLALFNDDWVSCSSLDDDVNVNKDRKNDNDLNSVGNDSGLINDNIKFNTDKAHQTRSFIDKNPSEAPTLTTCSESVAEAHSNNNCDTNSQQIEYRETYYPSKHLVISDIFEAGERLILDFDENEPEISGYEPIAKSVCGAVSDTTFQSGSTGSGEEVLITNNAPSRFNGVISIDDLIDELEVWFNNWKKLQDEEDLFRQKISQIEDLIKSLCDESQSLIKEKELVIAKKKKYFKQFGEILQLWKKKS